MGLGAARTMQVAQRLYEGGYITYMRTDSITLSQTALKAAGQQVRELYGAEYHREQQYASKVKNAQEAHEAIRPAGETFRTPDQTGLSGDEAKLYRRIWKRTVASQMMPPKGETGHAAKFAVTTRRSGEAAGVRRSGTTITFKGWLKAYSEATESSRRGAERGRRRAAPPCRRSPRDRSRRPGRHRPRVTTPSRRLATPRRR